MASSNLHVTREKLPTGTAEPQISGFFSNLLDHDDGISASATERIIQGGANIMPSLGELERNSQIRQLEHHRHQSRLWRRGSQIYSSQNLHGTPALTPRKPEGLSRRARAPREPRGASFETPTSWAPQDEGEAFYRGRRIHWPIDHMDRRIACAQSPLEAEALMLNI